MGGVMPEALIQNFINPIMNPLRYRGYYTDKNNFDRIFPSGFLPHTVLRKENGLFFNGHYHIVKNLMETINNCIYERIIIKPTVGSSSGRGVRLFVKEKEVYKDIQNGDILNEEYLKNFGRDFIIQESLKQSDYLAQFNQTSVNTIRLFTYRSVVNDKVYILWQIIRIGQKGSFVDNAHAGGLFVGINKYGKLQDCFYNQYGDRFDEFNGINLKRVSYYIPNWENVKQFAKSIANNVAHHRLIQHDIMLDDENRPRLIEYNVDAPGIWTAHFTGQQVFGEFTDEIMQYCSRNKHYAEKTMFIPA